MTEHRLIIPESLSGFRADVASSELLNISRSSLKSRLSDKKIWINGSFRSISTLVETGDEIRLTLLPLPVIDMTPQSIELDILHEDNEFLAINKPAGMVVHAGGGTRDNTMVNALLFHLQSWNAFGDSIRPGIVHRLDRETSGVILVAKKPESLENLQNQFSKRIIQKEYRVLVNDNIVQDSLLIDSPIGRNPRDRKKMTVGGIHPREALTRLSVLERFGNCSYVAAYPKTGRTHQIRVHLASIHHPVIGDRSYGSRGKRILPESLTGRHLLHAFRIDFRHPASGESMQLYAPLPPDMTEALELLRRSLRD